MSLGFYLLEVPIEVQFAQAWWRVDFMTCRPDAPIEGVLAKQELIEEGRWKRWGVLLVRDRGAVIKAACPRGVVVARATMITEIPDEAGRLLGSFRAHENLWHVFDALSADEVARRRARANAGRARPDRRSESASPSSHRPKGSGDQDPKTPPEKEEPDLFGNLS